MWERFIKAMEYRAYCKAIQVLRLQGNYKKANEVLAYKKALYT